MTEKRKLYKFVERRAHMPGRLVKLQYLPTGNVHLWTLGKGRMNAICVHCGEPIPINTYRFAPAQGNNTNAHRIHERCVNALERDAKYADPTSSGNRG